MRTTHILPLAAALLLAACGGSADEDGDGKVSTQEAAAATDGMVKPEPGQYQASYELLEFDVPGMPEAAKERTQAMMGGAAEVAKGVSFCITPEQVASQGPRQMVENMAESNCTFAKFDVSGGTISADMQCTGADGKTSHVLMDGQMTATGSTMTMTTDQDMPDVGKVHMKTRVTSKRTGDCTA